MKYELKFLYEGSETEEACRGIFQAAWLRIFVCEVIRSRRIEKNLAGRYGIYLFGW